MELRGDRTRFGSSSSDFSLRLLDDVTSFTFDWAIAGDSTSLLSPDVTPALRLHITDGSTTSELIWEGAYNGTYGSTDVDTWYTTGSDDNFWRWVTGSGVTMDGGMVWQSIGDWANGTNSGGNAWYTDDAYITAISVGAGSSVGSGYHAFADNVTIGFGTAPPITYNFEAVPVPAVAAPALALMGILGLRRQRNGV